MKAVKSVFSQFFSFFFVIFKWDMVPFCQFLHE